MKKKLEIIYEDEYIIAVNKPCGLLSVQGRGGASFDPSVVSVLRDSGRKIFAVHRLDRDASGILILAKNEASHKYMNRLFEKKEISKKYLAVIGGFLDKKRGEIDKPIKAGGSGRMFVNFNGKPSITRYFVIKRLKKNSLIELEPVTGRRHQLRVHMYYLKHPIFGDRLYGDLAKQSAYSRLMLHAFRIEFKLPSGKNLTIRKDPPEEFLKILDTLE